MGYNSFGFSSGFVVSDPIYTTRTLRVYQAKEPISSLQFFELVGADDQHTKVSRQIKKYRLRRNIGRGIALAGLGMTIGGWVGASQAETDFELYVYSNTTLAGSLICFGGLLGSSFPASKENALIRTPLTSLSKVDVENKIDSYNDALREELGLSIEDVWYIESGGQQ